MTVVSDVLFSGSSSARILIYNRRVHDRSFLDAFLDPQVRLDIFLGFGLICFHKVLEDFCVGIRQNDLSILCGCCGIPARMLHARFARVR